MIDRTYETLLDIAMTPELYGEEPEDLTDEPPEVNAWGPFVVEAEDAPPYLGSRLRCRYAFELTPPAFVTTWVSERELTVTSPAPPLLEHGDQLAIASNEHGRVILRPLLSTDAGELFPDLAFADRNQLLTHAEYQLGLRDDSPLA